VLALDEVRYGSCSTKQLAACNQKSLQLLTGKPETGCNDRNATPTCEKYNGSNSASAGKVVLCPHLLCALLANKVMGFGLVACILLFFYLLKI
jgi:hypothetical protein